MPVWTRDSKGVTATQNADTPAAETTQADLGPAEYDAGVGVALDGDYRPPSYSAMYYRPGDIQPPHIQQISPLHHFNPHLKLESEDVFGGWDAGLSLGPLFGNRKYHAYYYSVDPQYATATRRAYRASGGYSGTLVMAGLSRRHKRIWMGGFIRYDNLSGAQFEDSPLLETDHSFMAGIAIAWIFKQSSRTLPE